jgi:hypothetical protein
MLPGLAYALPEAGPPRPIAQGGPHGHGRSVRAFFLGDVVVEWTRSGVPIRLTSRGRAGMDPYAPLTGEYPDVYLSNADVAP